MNDKQV